jgi:hypothetical protein
MAVAAELHRPLRDAHVVLAQDLDDRADLRARRSQFLRDGGAETLIARVVCVSASGTSSSPVSAAPITRGWYGGGFDAGRPS